MSASVDIVAILCGVFSLACNVILGYMVLKHIAATDLIWGMWLVWMVATIISAFAKEASN